MLRERGAPARAELMKAWGGHMFFMMAAMELLPNFAGVVFRGFPARSTVESKYKIGRPIQGAPSRAQRRTLRLPKTSLTPTNFPSITVTNGRESALTVFF